MALVGGVLAGCNPARATADSGAHEKPTEVRDVLGGTLEKVPPWIGLLIAKYSLEPLPSQPYQIWRYRHQSADAYYFPPRCCDIPSSVYDANGTHLGGGYFWDRDFQTTGGTLVWKREPDNQGLAAARAILQDPRFSQELVLLTFARLEVETGVAWYGGDPKSSVRWPSELKASAAPLVVPNSGMAPEQVAMDFLVRYKALFGMVDPASELVSEPMFGSTATFQQKVNGLVVACLYTNVELNDRRVVDVKPGYSRDLRTFDTRPALDGAAAVNAVRAEAHREHPTLNAEVRPPSLEINFDDGQNPCGGDAKLSYEGVIRVDDGDSGTREERYFVDARSGVAKLYP
jgi:hypothetical protein